MCSVSPPIAVGREVMEGRGRGGDERERGEGGVEWQMRGYLHTAQQAFPNNDSSFFYC